MKKITTLLSIFIILCCVSTSCITASSCNGGYEPYETENYVVVDDGICYVYYTNPSISFLNTLHIVNGTYYYWYIDNYIPVVFPRWKMWEPNRFFYYDGYRWTWRNRVPYEYRNVPSWNGKHHSLKNMTPKPNNTFPNKFGNGRRPLLKNETHDIRNNKAQGGAPHNFNNRGRTNTTIQINTHRSNKRR